MVTIIGGKVGLDYTVSLNCPHSGSKAPRSNTGAIVYSGLEAASFTGAYITTATKATHVLESSEEGIEFGQVSLIDTIIEYPESASLNDGATSGCVAIKTVHSLYLKNVYMKNCDNFVTPQVSVGREEVLNKSIICLDTCE